MRVEILRDLATNFSCRVDESYADSMSSDPEDMIKAQAAAIGTLQKIGEELTRVEGTPREVLPGEDGYDASIGADLSAKDVPEETPEAPAEFDRESAVH